MGRSERWSRVRGSSEVPRERAEEVRNAIVSRVKGTKLQRMMTLTISKRGYASLFKGSAAP